MKSRLDKKLVAALPFLESEGCVIYDRRGRIVFANERFMRLAHRSSGSFKGRRVDRLFLPIIGETAEILKAYLAWQKNRKNTRFAVVLELGSRILPKVYASPREEKCGVRLNLYAREIGKDHVLLKAVPDSMNMTRNMGNLSMDFLLTVDPRGRIAGATEGLKSMFNRPQALIFNRPVGRLFLPGMFRKALARQAEIRRDMLKALPPLNADWERIFCTDFSGPAWKKSWIAENHLRFSRAKDGLRLDSDLGSGFLTLREPLDTETWDYRWDIRATVLAPNAALCVFFNGWDCQPDVNSTSPDLGGYLAGYYRVGLNAPVCRIKRRGWAMADRKVTFDPVHRPFNLSVVKCGGAFRFTLDGTPAYECADPEYASFGEYPKTGIVISSYPLVLHEAVLRRRKRSPHAGRDRDSHFDLRFIAHPEEIFEARFFERATPEGRVTDIYLRNVTELRKAQKAVDEQVRQKTLALDQIHDELTLAGDVLNSLLPRQFPEVPGVRFHSYFKPSGQVGGDLFDVLTVDADRVAILMYDVSGHGVPAALISVMTKTLFQKHYHPGATVIEILEKLNADLYRDMPGRSFVTLFFGLLDHKRRELRYSGAGFTTPVAVSGEDLLLLNTRGVPLGIGDRITSQEHVISFEKPTKLLLFTDGLYEIFNAKDEFYGPKRMTAFIQKHARLSLEGLIRHLLEEHRSFTAGLDQKDDISILGVDLGTSAGGGA